MVEAFKYFSHVAMMACPRLSAQATSWHATNLVGTVLRLAPSAPQIRNKYLYTSYSYLTKIKRIIIIFNTYKFYKINILTIIVFIEKNKNKNYN